MFLRSIQVVLIHSLMVFSPFSSSETRIEIKKDVIKGNSELPKVMYIIPWQTTITKSDFKGVKLDNYYEKLLVPFHPHRLKSK